MIPDIATLSIKLDETGETVVGPGRPVPAGLRTVADELEEPGTPPHLDEEPRDRVPLTIEAHQVARVFLGDEQPVEREVAATREQVVDDLVVSLELAEILAQERRPLISPARHRAAEVGGEDGVGHLVRQARCQDPVESPLHGHGLVGDLPPVETE